MIPDRALRRAFASAPFRFALMLALVFAAGSAALVQIVRLQVGGYGAQATSSLLRDEAAVLTGEYRTLGLSGLTDAMTRHARAGAEAQFRYLLVDANGRRLFGSLPVTAARVGPGAISDPEPEGGTQALERLGVRLPDGLLLVVATDAFDIESVRRRLVAATVAGGIVVTLLALIGGFLAGRTVLARLDRVNVAVERIIEGERSERLPEIGVAPEFGHLTRNLNRMLDRNAAAMEALRQVSTAIAHDLRTPLTVLRQELETARDRADPDPGAFGQAIGQVDALLSIFHALLRIGTIEGGEGRRRFAAVDLSDLIGRIHDLYVPLAEDAGHRFSIDAVPGAIVTGDAALLTQLFTNLIENAIGHTPAGTSISMTLVRDGHGHLVRIADDGPGVREADLPHIFRRFYRGEAAGRTIGSGLGLSLAAAIADLHGASLTAEPRDPGLAMAVRFPT